MKQTTLLLIPVLAGAMLGHVPAAHADIAWQHVGRVTVGGKQVATFDFRNYWSGDNHRAQLSFDATTAARAMGAPPTAPVKGEAISIERLGDDRLIVAVPELKMHMDEPYKSLKSRVRFNLWEGLDPKLAKEPIPPELTPEQRQRLGREIRAALSPVYSQISKVYFRALPKTRVIDGLTCRGYRYTTLTNVGSPKEPQWVRGAAEWWLANREPGDQSIIDFTTKVNEMKKEAGPPTVSMWFNELAPIMWETSPEESHAALASLIGKPGEPDYGFRGTPMQFFVTLTPPPAAQLMAGDVRVAITLKTRGLGPITADKFEPPVGSKQQKLEPVLQMARNAIKQAQAKMKSVIKDGMNGNLPMWWPQD